MEYTGEVHPGLVVVGIAVSTTYGLPRMEPKFSGMLISGRKGGTAYNLLKDRIEDEPKQISL